MRAVSLISHHSQIGIIKAIYLLLEQNRDVPKNSRRRKILPKKRVDHKHIIGIDFRMNWTMDARNEETNAMYNR